IPETVAERAGVGLDAVLDLDLPTLRQAAATLGVALEQDYVARHGPAAGGYLLTDIFEAAVEAELVQPTFVCQYPAAVSPLARRNRERPQFVDRFEAFITARELCNAFSEL